MPIQANGFLRHIQSLNKWNPDHFRPFCISGERVGYLKDFMCQALMQWPGYFSVSDAKVELLVNASFDTRNRILDEVVRQLVEQGVIANYLGEPYPVTAKDRNQLLAILDRGSAACFGIRTYGQHLNGYVSTDAGLKLWIARRAADRIHFPNKLDNLVAGGLPQGLSLETNLRKECREEADIPAELVKNARPVGAISYCCETPVGLKPDTLYCYDLALPDSFVPQNTDGEVAEFQLMDLDVVIKRVRDTDEFKANCNLVILDFLVRHGAIRPEEGNYLELVAGLHI